MYRSIQSPLFFMCELLTKSNVFFGTTNTQFDILIYKVNF